MIPRRSEALALAFFTVIALVTRFYNFWEAPHLGFVDIGAHAQATLDLLDSYRNDRPFPPWKLGWGNVPNFYWYTLVPFVATCESPILGQKIATVTFSLIALGLTYLFLRDLSGSLFALFGVGTLVFSRYFLFYSRYPMEPIDLFLFFVAALLLFRRGFTSKSFPSSILQLALSAFFLAGAQHIYLAARTLVPIFAGYFLILAPRSGGRLRFLGKGATFWGLFCVFVAPLAYEYYTHPDLFRVRHDEIGTLGRYSVQQLARNYLESFRFFVDRADCYAGQNLPDTPYIQPAIRILLLFGITSSLMLIKHEAIQLALLILLLTLPAASLTTEPWNSKRLLNGMLAVSIFSAYPVAHAALRLETKLRHVWVLPLLPVFLVVAFGLRDFKLLFVDFNNHPACVSGTGYPQVALAHEVARSGNTHEVFISANRGQPQAASFHPHVLVTKFDPVQHVPLGHPVERDVVLLLEDSDAEWLPILQSFYPDARGERIAFRHGCGFMRYQIPARNIQDALGVRVTLHTVGGGNAKTFTRSWTNKDVVIPFEEAVESVEIAGLAYIPGAFAVVFHGYGRISLSIGGDLVLEQPIYGKTDLIKSLGLRGWLPWRLVFKPSAKERDCMLSRRNQAVEFVHRDPPETGVLQICFNDLHARQPQSISFSPSHRVYSYWHAPPRDLVACTGVLDVTRTGDYEIRFQSGGRSRFRLGEVLNATRSANVPLNAVTHLDPGLVPYHFLTSMRTATPRIPNYSLVARSVESGMELPHRPPRSPLSTLLKQATEIGLGGILMGNFWVEKYSQTWGDLGENVSVGGGPLKIEGTVFPLGLGSHAESRISIGFPPRYHTLSGFCGIDDSASRRGSAIFKIIGRDQVLFESPVKRGGEPPMEFSVPIGGLSGVDLVALPTEDGKDKDHADWVNLQLH